MKILRNHGGVIFPVSTLCMCVLVLFFLSQPLDMAHAQDGAPNEKSEASPGEEGDLSVEYLLEEFHSLEKTGSPLALDTNGDGRIDYLVHTQLKTNEKMMEVLDFNNDGKMDDFYFYKRGVLQKRAVDSNYDGMIDLRVYIKEGVYISYYEKDSDFDGKMETIKRYSSEESDEEGGTE